MMKYSCYRMAKGSMTMAMDVQESREDTVPDSTAAASSGGQWWLWNEVWQSCSTVLQSTLNRISRLEGRLSKTLYTLGMQLLRMKEHMALALRCVTVFSAILAAYATI